MTNLDKEILASFGANLKKVRTAKGHSLRTLYASSEIDNSALGRMERGETNVTLLTHNKTSRGIRGRYLRIDLQ